MIAAPITQVINHSLGRYATASEVSALVLQPIALTASPVPLMPQPGLTRFSTAATHFGEWITHESRGEACPSATRRGFPCLNRRCIRLK
jgi:hypothetical protein